MTKTPSLAIIGGTGVYNMPDLEEVEELDLSTPFGKPSAPIVVGTLGGVRVAFLARHGEGHRLLPSEVNAHANIYALKSLGVERITSISACGSLREDYAPGDIVIPDQLYDHTKNRRLTFFGDGPAAHIGFADPFCPDLSEWVFQAVKAAGGTVHLGGALITVEGPRFSTRAESNTYRSWGMSLINMTSVPEAFLAREAEICYTVMNHVTDYDVWHGREETVSVDLVLRILKRNTQLAQDALRRLVHNLSDERNCECVHALANTIITQPDVIPSNTQERLSLLVDKYL
jgi:5'-methylthioadenosine phosphorylase